MDCPDHESMTNEALAALWRDSRDQDAADQLVKRFDRLLGKVAWRYVNVRNDWEDLYQEAVIGILSAAAHYDDDRVGPAGHRTSFASCAWWWVAGSVANFVRDHGNIGRVPRRDWAERKGYHADSLDAVLDAFNEGVVADGTGDGLLFVQRMFAALSVCDEPPDERMDVEKAVETLDWRLRYIVRRHYWERASQRQIAGELGISQMQVSRLLRRAQRELRARLGGSIGYASERHNLPDVVASQAV